MSKKASKAKDGSYFHNNFLEVRPSETGPVISGNDDTVTCRLNGYAIIPFEKYLALTNDTSVNIPEFLRKVAKTNKDLSEADVND